MALLLLFIRKIHNSPSTPKKDGKRALWREKALCSWYFNAAIENIDFIRTSWEYRTLSDMDTIWTPWHGHHKLFLLLGLLSQKYLPRLQLLSISGVLDGSGWIPSKGSSMSDINSWYLYMTRYLLLEGRFHSLLAIRIINLVSFKAIFFWVSSLEIFMITKFSFNCLCLSTESTITYMPRNFYLNI